jgi:alpha-ketoglutarate-dependent taurine dioxygenase
MTSRISARIAGEMARRHAYGIPGMTEAESAALLAELLDFAARPPRTTGHHWQPGDLAIWDNRRVLHRVLPYDYTEARVMRHTRVAGDPVSELAGTLPDVRAKLVHTRLAHIV